MSDSIHDTGRTCASIEESSRVPVLVELTSDLAPKSARNPAIRVDDPSARQAGAEIDEATWRLRGSD